MPIADQECACRPDEADGRSMIALRFLLVASISACARTDHPEPARTKAEPAKQTAAAESDAMTQPEISKTCDAAKRAIEVRHFVGWRGLPPGCSPEAVFGVKLDDSWGAMPLGASFESARSRLVELTGYGRALVYARDGAVAMFDAMAPQLDRGWPALSADLGAPEAAFDWVFGTIAMPAGERVYAQRGLTIFLNPENQAVAYISVHVPTTVDEYARRLRPPRAKRAMDRP